MLQIKYLKRKRNSLCIYSIGNFKTYIILKNKELGDLENL